MEELSKKREAIAREIAELTATRNASLRGSSGSDSLDAAIKTSLRELGGRKGLAFP